jgi:hypothetical protein
VNPTQPRILASGRRSRKVDLLGQLEIALRDAPDVVRRQRHCHGSSTNVDVRMMLVAVRQCGYAVHENDGVTKVKSLVSRFARLFQPFLPLSHPRIDSAFSFPTVSAAGIPNSMFVNHLQAGGAPFRASGSTPQVPFVDTRRGEDVEGLSLSVGFRNVRPLLTRRSSAPPSSSGLGYRPLTAKTGVRLPVGVLQVA